MELEGCGGSALGIRDPPVFLEEGEVTTYAWFGETKRVAHNPHSRHRVQSHPLWTRVPYGWTYRRDSSPLALRWRSDP